jgi:endonuclease/exonuclease/phosphatase family metal-dependent hydrolase
MDERLRIATWNLEHASNKKPPTIIELQLKQILRIRPDVLILTETCEEVDLAPHGFTCFPSIKNEYGKFSSVVHLGPRIKSPERLTTYDERTAVCVRMNSPLGRMIIYATIITYHGNLGPKKESRAWAKHYEAIRSQDLDWEKLLHDSDGNLPLIVAGDFNQTRDGSSRTYGTKAGRELLGAALSRNNLTCLTTEDFGANGKLQVDPSKGRARNNIDHICITDDTFRVIEVGAWDHFTESGQYLSDHNGVYVDIESRLAQTRLVCS